MTYITGRDRRQTLLLPEAVDDYVAADNPVRFIDAFVDELDLAAAGFARVVPEATGRPGYAPGDLLKLYIYGYLNRVRSSRRLEAETHRNLEVTWLLRRLKPDLKTIADFRRDNRAAFRSVFREFVLLCRRLDLYGRELLAVDGTRIKAVNNKDRNFTRASLTKFIRDADERLADYLRRLDEGDATEGGAGGGSRTQNLAEKIATLRAARDRRESLLAELERTGEDQISLTDPDSRAMAAHTKVGVGYNVQIAVDAKHKLIAEQAVTNDVLDMGLRNRRPNPRAGSRCQTIDGGRRGLSPNIAACEEAGLTPHVPRPQRGSAVRGLSRDEFRYDAERDAYVCPAGQVLTDPPRPPARYGKDRLRKPESLPRLPPARPLHKRCPVGFPSRIRGRARSHGRANSGQARHPRSPSRNRRTPLRLDQAMDEPGRLSDAASRQRPRRIQPHRACLQSPPSPQYRRRRSDDRGGPKMTGGTFRAA